MGKRFPASHLPQVKANGSNILKEVESVVGWVVRVLDLRMDPLSLVVGVVNLGRLPVALGNKTQTRAGISESYQQRIQLKKDSCLLTSLPRYPLMCTKKKHSKSTHFYPTNKHIHPTSTNSPTYLHPHTYTYPPAHIKHAPPHPPTYLLIPPSPHKPCSLDWGPWEAPTLHPCPHPSPLAWWHQDQKCIPVGPSPSKEKAINWGEPCHIWQH